MTRLRFSRFVPVLAVFAVIAAPALAQGIPAGIDSWATPGGGGTYIELDGADWAAICGASNGQAVQVTFKGVAIQGQGDSSVEVQRLQNAVFNGQGIAYVPVRMRTLSFVSTGTTATPCGNLDFRVGLNGRQDTAQMEIRREGSWGGHFFVDLPVDAKIEAVNSNTGTVVGSVIKEGILYEPTSGTPWAYQPPSNPLDPNAPWHPGVTSTGQKVSIARYHEYPASHLYKPVTYCAGGVGIGSSEGSIGVTPECEEVAEHEPVTPYSN